MNSTEIIKVLDNLSAKFGIAIDWSQKNVTPYLMDLYDRIIKYEIATSIVQLIILSICLFVAVRYGVMHLIKRTSEIKKFNEGKRSWEHDGLGNQGLDILVSVAVPIVMVICFIGIPAQIYDLISCVYLPEKVVYEIIIQYAK